MTNEERIAIGEQLYNATDNKQKFAEKLAKQHGISISSVWDCRARYMKSVNIAPKRAVVKKSSKSVIKLDTPMGEVSVEMIPRPMYDELVEKYERVARENVSMQNLLLLAGLNLKDV